MLAALGFVVPEFVRVPGAQFSFEAIPQVRARGPSVASLSLG